MSVKTRKNGKRVKPPMDEESLVPTIAEFKPVLREMFVVLIGMLIVVVSVQIFLMIFDHELLSTCKRSPYTKATNPDTTQTALVSLFVRNALAFGLIRVLLLLLGARLYFTTAQVRRMNTLKLLIVLFIAYFPSIIGLETIKYGSADMECSGHGNSISGHAFYIIWAILTLWYMTRMFKREKVLISAAATGQESGNAKLYNILERFDAHLALWTLPIGILSLGIQAFFTYWYGYHSIRQMLYGTIAAIFHVGISIYLGEKYLSKS